MRPTLLVLAALAFAAPAAAQPASDRAEVRLEPSTGEIEGLVVLDAPGPLIVRLAGSLGLLEARTGGRLLPVTRGDGAWTVPATADAPVELRYAGRMAMGPDASLPFLGPEGGFLPGGSGWLPEIAGRRVGIELTLDVPEPYAAVATGKLVEERQEGDRYRARFLPEPAAGDPSAFVGEWAIAERRAGAISVRTYFHPDDAGLTDLYLERAGEYLQGFERTIGAYPYAGFSVVAGPLPVGLGFPGLTYVARRILPLPFMQTGSLAHEILHSWWGGAVGVDYGNGNWAEGLTTYMADYGLAEAEGADAAKAMRLAWLRDFAALPAGRDRPLRSFVARDHDASQVVGYGKAAFVFHMLRRQIGDAAFRAGIRRFYADHRLQRAGWADLRGSFEAVTGRDLRGFFEQWLDRTGAPRLTLAEANVSADGHAVDVVLRQDEPAYDLVVPVTIRTEQGSTRHEVALAGPQTQVTLEAQTRPRAVAIDPDHDLFRVLAPGEAPPILRDVTLAIRPAGLLATPDPTTEALARRLAGRLAEEPRFVTIGDQAAGTALLVIGLTPLVEAALATAGLPPLPAELKGRGTARVWTAARPDAPPVLAVAADDPMALEALSRPLPHYRRDSYLVFEGGRVVDRGVWPAGESDLTRRFDGSD